jgi:enamine deaminase RidA (YjgF/YER057c/UK114 family)
MTVNAEQRLVELGIELPEPFAPAGNYVPAVRSGRLVFVSGHGPTANGAVVYRGKVDSVVGVEDAYQAARLTALNCLASLRAELGSLDRVERVVKVLGLVNADPGFERHPEVINGASELFVDVFGERGGHARSAVGMSSLPFGIPVEVELVVEVADVAGA